MLTAKSRQERFDLVAMALIAVLTFFVFQGLSSADYINFDDDYYVAANPHMIGGWSLENLKWAFTTTRGGFWFPLTWVSFLLDAAIWGHQPGGYHLTNLLLHILNSLLLFHLMKYLLRSRRQALAISLLFALHPLHVESVAWVTERKDVLSILFGLICMTAYHRYVLTGSRGPYLFSIVAFLFSLMSKPMLVMLPFLLLLLDFWLLCRVRKIFESGCALPEADAPEKSPPEASIGRLLLEKWPYGVIMVFFSLLTIVVNQKFGALMPLENYPLSLRFSNALVSYLRYIQKLFWPFDLVVFYPYTEIPLFKSLAAASIIAIVTYFSVRHARRQPYLLVGWLWYVVTLLPVIGIFQSGSQSFADRFSYFPSIGIFLMLIHVLLPKKVRAHHLSKWRAVLTGSVLVCFSMIAWVQVRYWQNSETLFRHTLAVIGDHFYIHRALGEYYLRQNRLTEGVQQFGESLALRPDADLYRRTADNLIKLKRIQEAITYYQKAIAMRPDNAEAYNNIGTLLAMRGNPSEALEYYAKAVKIDPDFRLARENLAHIRKIITSASVQNK